MFDTPPKAWFHRHSKRFSVHAYMVGVCDASAWEQVMTGDV